MPLPGLLTLLCRRHHRAVHEEGYQVERREDGELSFRHPYGHAIPCVPPRVRIPDAPAEIIRGWNEAGALDLDAHSATPGWLGEPLDVGYAIDLLHPLGRSG